MDFGRHLLKRFESPDGRRWLDIYKRFDGLFCFQEFSEGPPKTELRGDSNVSPGMESAAYDSAEAAEADARRRIPWLREISTEARHPEGTSGRKQKRPWHSETDPPTGAVMTAQPRYPFVALGVPLVLLLLFTFGPIIILLTGGMVADALGCTMPISAAGPCPFMGVDIATSLALAVAFGYLAFFTFPAGTALLSLWLVAAVIVTLVWSLCRWRAKSSP
jgi:hypothetical protein